MPALYSIDQNENLRTSHANKAVQDLYKDFLKEPNSEIAHHLLHTNYTERKILA